MLQNKWKVLAAVTIATVMIWMASISFGGSRIFLKEKWEFGVEYTNYEKGSCTEKENKKCISAIEYRQICDKSTSVTNGAVKMASMLSDNATKSLFEGGSLDKVIVIWVPKNNGCGALLEASGMYNGTSMRKSISGRATSFIFTEKGTFLVTYIDTSI